MVQESIKHFPIPLRKSLKAIAEGDFLGRYKNPEAYYLASASPQSLLDPLFVK